MTMIYGVLPVSKLSDYFDQVYVINLDCEPDKMVRMKKIMRRLDTHYKRITAINGHSTRAQIYWRQLKKKGKPRDPNWPEVTVPGMACTLSHMSAIKHAMESRKQRVLIFEDDIMLHRDFEYHLQKMDRLPEWKLLYLGATDYGYHDAKSVDGFYHPFQVFGRFAYGVDRSIFQELLDVWTATTNTGDSMLASVIQPRYSEQCFVFDPNIVVANVEQSTIRGRRDQLEQAAKVGWKMSWYS